MKPVSTSATTEVLIPIWQRVLQLPSVGLDDNFFELGGDSAQALELFNEIAVACGRELPPVMIYQAPTIGALAAVLDQPTTPRMPPLIQLKAGTAASPIFIAHGLGGSVMDFYQIVKQVHTPRAIYGMQAKGIDGTEEPLDRIEDMAQYSLAAIQEIQPRGPYFLMGFSLGGLVVLEIAQRLVARGEEIGLLAMLDSYPHISRISRGQRSLLWVRRTWRRMARKLQWLGVPQPFQTELDVEPSPSLRPFRDSAYRALAQYEPSFYSGRIDFVRASIPTDWPANPAAVWSHLAREFEVQTAPGDHLGIMTTHFEGLARIISTFVKQADPQ